MTNRLGSGVPALAGAFRWLIRTSVATTAAAVVLLSGGVRSSAQGGSPPDFSPAGLDPGRHYFSAAPFEAIDMINGDLNLTFTDLVLPGNAGFDLRFVRTFGHQTGLWRFGLAGIPWRIGRPDGNPNDFSEYPLLFMADDSVRKLFPRNGSDVFYTEDFWRYTKSTRTLEMPNGWVATFESGNPSGGVMVAEVHDLFGNSIDFDWEGGAATDVRPLRLNGVFQMLGFSQTPTRTVEFQYDSQSSECGWIPRKMIYLGREWSYDCEFAYPELQSGWRLTKATPPVGPAWEYAYVNGNNGSVTVTTPQGGEVTYQFAEQILPPSDGIPRSVISSRTTDGPDIDSGTWQFSLSQPPGGQPSGTVTTPSGRQIEFQHGWKPFKQGWLLDRKIVRDSGGAEVAKVELGYTEDMTFPILASKAITQDGLSYTTILEYHTENFRDYNQPWRITETGQKQRVTERTFDYDFEPSTYLLNRVASETVTVDGRSFTSSYEYENINAFLEAETKSGVRTTFGRDAYGNRNRTTDANDHSTTATFDFGVAKDTTTPEYEIHRSINSDGTVAWEEIRDQNHRTQFNYDDLGRVTLVSPPGVTATQTTYNHVNGRQIETRRGARIVTVDLDGFGRQIRTVDSAGVKTSTQYDAEGYVTYEGAPYSSIDRGDTLTYDAIGRLKRRTHPGGSYVEYTYNGHSVAIRDEENHTTTQVWNYFGAPSGGRLAQVTDAAGKTWQYAYHPLGMLEAVTPPDSRPGRSWHYNAKTFLDSETHPESGTVTYALDNVGSVVTRHDARQQEFTYTYDGLNRLKRIDAPGTAHDVEIRYEGPNRKEMWNGHVFSEFHYDATDRLRERTDQITGQSFTTLYDYDGLDNLTRIEYPNHRKVRYEIDPGNGSRVTRVYEEDGTTFADQIDYHASGAVSEFRSGNGLSNHVGFDLRSRPEGLDAGPLHLIYGYDDAGNVRSITDARPVFSQTFEYDAVDRLTHVFGSFGATNFTYAADGNRQTKGDVTYTYSPTTNRLHQVTGGVEAAVYGYDDNGNLHEAPGTTITYTPFNMMETFAVTNAQTQVTSTTTYRYDADNVRALRQRAGGVSDYFVHGLSGELLAEYENAGTGVRWLQDYVYLGSKLIASVSAPQATVGFTTASSSVLETAGSVTATVQVTTSDGMPLQHEVRVSYSTANVSATAGADYVGASGTLIFPAGSSTLPVTITLTDDTLDEGEGNESFSINLSAPVGAEIGVASHLVTLRDNEPHLVADVEVPGTGGAAIASAVVAGAVVVRGFAIDSHAASGTGITSVTVYADAVGGGTSATLGTASYGLPSSDGQSYGQQFANSGFKLIASPLPPGLYDVWIAAQFASGGSANTKSSAVRILVVPATDLERAGDIDGEAGSEITVYNVSSGLWSWLTSSSGYSSGVTRSWGGTGYQPVPGDYDGDGKADLGLYVQTTGMWYVLLSGANFTTTQSVGVGGNGWTPVPSDYDGDGKTDFVVYNTATGQWYGLKSGQNYTTTVNLFYGGAGWIATPADFDGDGKTDIGVYQSTTGSWSVLRSSTNYTTSLSQSVGGTGWVPVAADYDGDRKADFVVFNSATGHWYGYQSAFGYTTTLSVNVGLSGYAPVKGDYDGDERADLAMYLPSAGAWYIRLSSSNFSTALTRIAGGPGHVAVPQYP